MIIFRKLFLLALLLFRFLLKILPFRVTCSFISVLFRVFSCFAIVKRKNVRLNLERVYQFGETLHRPFVRVSSVFGYFGRYFAEFWGPRRWREEIMRDLEIVGREHLDQALEKGKGVILLSAHVGNWELGAWILARLGFQMAGLYWAYPDEGINRLFVKQRCVEGLQIITWDDKGVLRSCMQVLRENRVLAIVADIDYSNTGVMVDWWGQRGRISRAPYLFARRTDAEIIPAICVWKNGSHKIICEEALNVQKTTSEQEFTDWVADVYRKWILKYPQQRLVFRRFCD